MPEDQLIIHNAVATFSDSEAATKAADTLIRGGIPRENVRLLSRPARAANHRGARRTSRELILTVGVGMAIGILLGLLLGLVATGESASAPILAGAIIGAAIGGGVNAFRVSGTLERAREEAEPRTQVVVRSGNHAEIDRAEEVFRRQPRLVAIDRSDPGLQIGGGGRHAEG